MIPVFVGNVAATSLSQQADIQNIVQLSAEFRHIGCDIMSQRMPDRRDISCNDTEIEPDLRHEQLRLCRNDSRRVLR